MVPLHTDSETGLLGAQALFPVLWSQDATTRRSALRRVCARRPSALAAVMAALLGSAGHAGPSAAQRIAGLFVSFSVGFIRPPSLTYEQVTRYSLNR